MNPPEFTISIWISDKNGAFTEGIAIPTPWVLEVENYFTDESFVSFWVCFASKCLGPKNFIIGVLENLKNSLNMCTCIFMLSLYV